MLDVHPLPLPTPHTSCGREIDGGRYTPLHLRPGLRSGNLTTVLHPNSAGASEPSATAQGVGAKSATYAARLLDPKVLTRHQAQGRQLRAQSTSDSLSIGCRVASRTAAAQAGASVIRASKEPTRRFPERHQLASASGDHHALLVWSDDAIVSRRSRHSSAGRRPTGDCRAGAGAARLTPRRSRLVSEAGHGAQHWHAAPRRTSLARSAALHRHGSSSARSAAVRCWQPARKRRRPTGCDGQHEPARQPAWNCRQPHVPTGRGRARAGASDG